MKMRTRTIIRCGSRSLCGGREPTGGAQHGAPSLLFIMWQASDPATTNPLPIILIAIAFLFVAIIAAVAMKLIADRRDAGPADIPRYLIEPPDDLPPPLAYALLFGTNPNRTTSACGMAALLFYLAHQRIIMIDADGTNRANHIMIRPAPNDQASAGTNNDTTQMLRAIVPDDQPRPLDHVIPIMQNIMPQLNEHYRTTLQQMGVEHEGAAQQRITLRTAGVWIIGLACLLPVLIIVGLMLSGVEFTPALTAILVVLTSLTLSIGILLVASSLLIRQRTPDGERQAAQWNAFRRHLTNIERLTTDETRAIAATWERDLPYAIMFGAEKRFVAHFAAHGAAAPTWYHLHRPVTTDLRQQMIPESETQTLQSIGGSLLALFQLVILMASSLPDEPILDSPDSDQTSESNDTSDISDSIDSGGEVSFGE